MVTRQLVSCGIAAIGLLIGWWYFFRPEVVENPALGRFTYHRWFGRVVAVDLDVNRDGTADAGSKFSWSAPYEGILDGPGCFYPEARSWQDTNSDGLVDTWYHVVEQRDGAPCVYAFFIDTNADGRHDWSFTSNDTETAFQDIKKRLRVE